MQGIKALVIALGVLIVAGLVLLGYGMYAKARKLGGSEEIAVQPVAPGAAPLRAFGTVPVTLAPGGRVEDMAAVAGRLAVRVSEGETSRILLLDPASGAVAGSFVLAPAAAAAR
jgi:hypothetical protein